MHTLNFIYLFVCFFLKLYTKKEMETSLPSFRYMYAVEEDVFRKKKKIIGLLYICTKEPFNSRDVRLSEIFSFCT